MLVLLQVAQTPGIGSFVEASTAAGNVSVPVAATPNAMELSSELPQGVFELRLALTKCDPPQPAAQVWALETITAAARP